MRESTFSFWQDTDFNAIPDQPLTPAADAYQGQPGEEESWLFEATAADGTYLSVQVTVYDHEGRARLTLSWPGQEAVTREITVPFTAASSHLDLQAGGVRARQEGEYFFLQWLEGDINLDLKYQPLLAGWQPGGGRINYGEKGNKYFIWMIPVPRARVSGTLAVAGDRRSFQGNGYHDHRRYNFPLDEAMAGAYLGRFYAGDYIFLWAAFRGNRLYSGQEITALYLAREGQQPVSSGNLTLQVYEQENKNGLDFPVELSLQAGVVPPAALNLKDPVVLATRAPSRLQARSLYCRHRGELKIATQPELTLTGQGVTETLAPGRS
ncbi:hypothetical protein SDD30_02620 [Moorella naiadis]|uniref:hypothetical protein n=1 Tax=Moorella naiadis (nom. illeg.) TaxID=3093670 RepID=UPI003D9C9CEE